MADSAIEWTDATWNPTTGCDRISPGCSSCYAATMARRLKAMGQPKYQNDGDPTTSGPGFALTVHPDVLDVPARWRTPKMVFVDSMSDLFHTDVPDAFIADVFDVMAAAPQHTFQVLTKRSQRLAALAPSLVWPDNVWMGVSVENDRYTFRVDHLRQVPAAVRFVSAEPLIGPAPNVDLDGIDWVIVGGESGSGARPIDIDWVDQVVERADSAGTAVFVKQMGSAWARDNAATGKGSDPALWPERLRRREMPARPTAAS